MCVRPDALLSALVFSMREHCREATAQELGALLGAGCSRDEVRRALSAYADRAPFARAIALLDHVEAPPKRR